MGLGAVDQRKLDEYLTGIRDLERRMQADKDWLRKPKPNVATLTFGKEQGLDPDKAGLEYRRYQRLMFDVIALALQTDSTRVIAYMPRMDGQDGTGTYRDMGNPFNYHEMTHHGEDPEKLKWFTKADIWYMEEWAYFLNKLKSIKEGDGTLLDHTLVAYGSSGGSINAHHNHHLPTMLAGGAPGRQTPGPHREGRRPARQLVEHHVRSHERAAAQEFPGRPGRWDHQGIGVSTRPMHSFPRSAWERVYKAKKRGSVCLASFLMSDDGHKISAPPRARPPGPPGARVSTAVIARSPTN